MCGRFRSGFVVVVVVVVFFFFLSFFLSVIDTTIDESCECGEKTSKLT